MVSRKVAWIPAVTGGALLVLLMATACGTPDAAPNPVTVPTISTSPQVSSPVPEVNTISVKPTTVEPTVDATTEPPPVETTPPPEPVLPPPVETTEPTEEPDRRPVVVQNARCEEEGARGVTLRGKQMVCSSSGRGRLRWQPA